MRRYRANPSQDLGDALDLVAGLIARYEAEHFEMSTATPTEILNHQSGNEIPRLEAEARTLKREIDRLTAALAAADAEEKPGAVVRAIADRERRLREVEARREVLKATPSVLDLEVRRLERETARRLQELRAALARNPVEARGVVEALVDGHLTCTALKTPEGNRFQIEGATTFGALFTKVASPAGFECGTPQIQVVDIAECSTIADAADPSKSPQKDAGGQSGGEKDPATSPSEAPAGAPPERLDAALVAAVASATAAGEWDLVELLAAKLRARARARMAGNVVDLDAARRKRD